MTPKSTCRSPNRRIHATSRSPPKTWRLRHYTNHYPSKPLCKQPTLPIHYFSTMRSSNNQCHLPTTNRPKVPNCLLLCKPYRTSHRRNHNSNPMSLLRGNNPNNLSRPNLLYTILPGQYKLRTNSQPNPTSNPRTSTPPTTYGHLMTTSKPNKHGTTTNNQPHSRTNHCSSPVQLIPTDNHFNRNYNRTNCLLYPTYANNNTTRNTTIPHHLNPKFLNTRASPDGPTHNSHNPTYSQT